MSTKHFKFTHAKFGTIRAIELKKDLWFDAVDVCECLGFSNPSATISKFVDEENQTPFFELDSDYSKDRKIIIDENGFQDLIDASKIAYAEQIQNWLDFQILPAYGRLIEQTEAITENCRIDITIDG